MDPCAWAAAGHITQIAFISLTDNRFWRSEGEEDDTRMDISSGIKNVRFELAVLLAASITPDPSEGDNGSGWRFPTAHYFVQSFIAT